MSSISRSCKRTPERRAHPSGSEARECDSSSHAQMITVLICQSAPLPAESTCINSTMQHGMQHCISLSHCFRDSKTTPLNSRSTRGHQQCFDARSREPRSRTRRLVSGIASAANWNPQNVPGPQVLRWHAVLFITLIKYQK